MAVDAPFPSLGDDPWGGTIIPWAEQVRENVNELDQVVNEGRLSPDQLSATFVGAQPRVLDVRSFGVVADGVTDDTEAIRDACDAARALASAATPVVLEFPAGVMRVTGTLGARMGGSRFERTSYVSWIGQGSRATTFKPVGSGFSLLSRARPSTPDPMYGITTQGFEIDGTEYVQVGEYHPEYGKGIFEQDIIDSTWRDLYIHDTLATGLGIDFLVNYVIDNVQTDRCGRGYSGTFSGNVGASGIGIGTGRYDVENGVVTNCSATDNKNHGIFWERQGDQAKYSRGMKAIGCYASGNRVNYADRGVDGLELVACNSYAATKDGVDLELGRNARVIGGEHAYNNRHGVRLRRVESSVALLDADVHHNGGHGVFADFYVGGGSREFVRVIRNRIRLNALAGIATLRTSADGVVPLCYLMVDENLIENNGQSGTTEGDGVRIMNNFEELFIRRNRIRDTQETGTQNRGIVLTNSLASGEVEGNDVRGNVGEGIVLAAGVTVQKDLSLARNRGYNDTLATISPTVGASPWTYTGPSQPFQFIFSGGAASVDVKINGAATPVLTSASDGVIALNGGDVVELTYTTKPIVKILRR